MKKTAFIFLTLITFMIFLNIIAVKIANANETNYKYFVFYLIILICFGILALIIKAYINNIKRIKRVMKLGYKTSAWVEDIIFCKEIDYVFNHNRPRWRVYINYCPVFKFIDESQNEQIFIYNNQPLLKRTGHAKNTYEIGDRVDISYIKSDEKIEQFDFDKKIFINNNYENMSTLSEEEFENGEGTCLYTKRELKIYSMKYKGNIGKYPTTNIKQDDFLINDINIFKQQRTETLTVATSIIVSFGLALAIVYELLIKGNN